MNFKLELFGYKCNEYPQLTIMYNQQTVYSGMIEEKTILEFDLKLQESTTITLQGINKSQGENGKWDTKLDDNGQIIADKRLTINNIWFDNVGMGQEWIRSLTIINNNGAEQFSSSTWWNNGSINFSIEYPLLDWIIQEKFIKVEKSIGTSSDSRSGEGKFGYKYIEEKIKTIRQIIND